MRGPLVTPQTDPTLGEGTRELLNNVRSEPELCALVVDYAIAAELRADAVDTLWQLLDVAVLLGRREGHKVALREADANQAGMRG